METENIILEHLRAIRKDVADVKRDVSDIKDQFASMRLRESARDGEAAVQMRQIAELQADVDRIKRRLDLVDETG